MSLLGKILIAEGKPQQALAEIEKEPNEWGKLMGIEPSNCGYPSLNSSLWKSFRVNQSRF